MSNTKNAWQFAFVLIALALLCAACGSQEAATPAATDVALADEMPVDNEAPPAEAPGSATKAVQPATAERKPASNTAAAPPQPRYADVTIPAGMEIEVELVDTLSSGVNQSGDPVRGRLSQDLYADGRLVASAGAEVLGTVTEVVPLKNFGGQPSLSLALETLVTDGGSKIPLVASYTELGKKQAARDAAKIGGGAAAGAIVGHQVDDDKGSKIGALIGGAIGTAVAAKTGKEVELPAGTLIIVPLESDMRVRLAS